MKKHVFDFGQGKSIFYSTLNADEAVLKAAQYADEAGLWIGNKAKVPVLNTNIGRLGNGSPTNVINVYRNTNRLFMAHLEQLDKNEKYNKDIQKSNVK